MIDFIWAAAAGLVIGVYMLLILMIVGAIGRNR